MNMCVCVCEERTKTNTCVLKGICACENKTKRECMYACVKKEKKNGSTYKGNRDQNEYRSICY